ncbi:MAG: nickel pincer cofactor biosynthesis protein LarC [Chloroflexota bacterium]|nr:nickel pincer cofactor biosynthesis protein LarC [Chloroflexota bacterium]
MILGALIDAGMSLDTLREQLGLLHLSGWTLEARQVVKGGLRATKVDLHTDPAVRLPYRSEVMERIAISDLSERVKWDGARIFNRLFEAEGRVHGSSAGEVHLHEMGDLDTIIDVMGVVIALESLSIDAVYASALPAGRGTVRTQHGLLPLPGPAVTELMYGAPLRKVDVEAELVTPTGAAIITTLAEGYEQHPTMTVTASGYGAGARDMPFANVLRVILGRVDSTQNRQRTPSLSKFDGTALPSGIQTEQVSVLETQIDDMPAEWYGHIMGMLLEKGALDAYFTPVQMKKNRPGTLLTVICSLKDVVDLTLCVLTETTTLGVRSYNVERLSLPRVIRTVETRFGLIQAKVANLPGGKERLAPEFESCLQAAKAHNVPLWEVYQEVLRSSKG